MMKTIGTLLAALALFVFAAPQADAQDEGGKKHRKPRAERRHDQDKGGKKKHKKSGKKGHKKHGKKHGKKGNR